MRLDTLLVLRVLATFAVVLGHSAAFFGGFDFTQWPQAPYLQSGAVTMFFAVSGFTIAWVADSRVSAGFVRFAFDRLMRLAIPLLPILLIFWAIEMAVLGSNDPYPQNLSVGTFLGNALFLQNMAGLGVEPLGLNRPLWTISIEFWTYMAFGGLFFAARDTSVIGLLMALVALRLLGPYFWTGRGAGLPLVWFAAAGLYFTLKRWPTLPKSTLIVSVPLLCVTAWLLTIPAWWPDGGEFSPLYNALIFALFVALMLIGSAIAVPSIAKRMAAFLGSFAYTAYLLHYPVLALLSIWNVIPHGTVGALLGMVICYGLAWLLSLPFERRYRPIRDGIWRRLTRSPQGTPQTQYRPASISRE